jgi:DNA helicase II / ATP-dependent DNA helicase PcrA
MLESTAVAGTTRWLVGSVNGEIDGFKVKRWRKLKQQFAAFRSRPISKRDLNTSSQLEFVVPSGVKRLAVVGVRLDGPEDVADLLGFVVEPAIRLGVELVIAADRLLEDLDDNDFFEPDFGYAYSLERLRWALERPRVVFGRSEEIPLPDNLRPDQTHLAAIGASSGITQIIAPAGSGKTTVLVERVKELDRRGVAAERIACLTFNKHAQEEMHRRLDKFGYGAVGTYTFHGLCTSVLGTAHELPMKVVTKKDGTTKHKMNIGVMSLGQWNRLIWLAKVETEQISLEVKSEDAVRKLSDIKLGLLMSHEEYAKHVEENGNKPFDRLMADLYRRYEALQIELGQREKRVPGTPHRRMDFDDQILWAIQHLRSNKHLRETFQRKFTHVLVDEYQDIEPAQELVVRMLAAPDDQLFCVGDEDQTLYAFRRASVERILYLDSYYPGLQRCALGFNYRCPPDVVKASAKLIRKNQRRFQKKKINADPERTDRNTIETFAASREQHYGAKAIASTLKTKKRGDIAVLARTRNALRPVALACARKDIPIDGPKELFEPSYALQALRCHLQLVLFPENATAELVGWVCRTPGRGIPFNSGGEGPIAEKLKAKRDFEAAFAGMKPPTWNWDRDERGRRVLWAPGELFTELAAKRSAAEAVALLRDHGGFDAWFGQDEGLYGVDEFALDDLESATRAAEDIDARFAERAELRESSSPLKLFHAWAAEQEEALAGRKDETNGIELRTIHGAKGCEWPQVIVVRCEDGHLPHRRSLEVSPEDMARGEGMEAERRLAYVAFTRAKQRLQLYYDPEVPRRFLKEAGIR